MNNKKVFFSIENSWPGLKSDFLTSKRVISKLNSLTDLCLVRPDDYNLETGKIDCYYRLDETNNGNSNYNFQLSRVNSANLIPKGEVFVIYGDNSRKMDFTLSSAKQMYSFLINLENQGNFRKFINTPRAEEKTLKTYLFDLSEEFDFVLRTYKFKSVYDLRNFLKQRDLIQKLALSCGGLGVKKISEGDFLGDNLNLEDMIFQEILPVGLETRIVIPGDPNKAFGRAHIGSIYNPNGDSGIFETLIYKPSKREIEMLNELRKYIGADIVGVDCLGFGEGIYSNLDRNYFDKENFDEIKSTSLKVIEVNGTGTGSIMYNKRNGRLLYDNSDIIVSAILDK